MKWDLKLPRSTIIQTWRSSSSLTKAVAKGNRPRFGPASNWYLDCGYGIFLEPDPSNSETPIKPPFLDWCSPYKNWRHVYTYDPIADIPGKHKNLMLGGEVYL